MGDPYTISVRKRLQFGAVEAIFSTVYTVGSLDSGSFAETTDTTSHAQSHKRRSGSDDEVPPSHKRISTDAPPTFAHRPTFRLVDPDYTVRPWKTPHRHQPKDCEFFDHGFRLLNTFGKILNSSSGSTDNYPADFTTYGDIRHARNNRGRAAKEKNSDGTWYYIRRKGYLLAGDEGADLYMFGVKKWDRSDNAELVKCVIQNDLPPTNAQVMGETRPNNLGIQGHRYSVGSPPKWVSTTRRQHDRLIPSTERSTGHELRKTFSPTRGSLTALGNGASNKVQHAPDVSHIDESTSLRVKKFGLADTLSQDVNNLKSLVLYGFPRENTLDEWSTPSPAENAASACNIAPRLAEQRGLSRNTPSSPDEGNVGEGLDNHASPMRSTSASHGLPQVANSEAGVGPRRPDPESTLPYPIDSVSEERSEECIDDLDTLRSLSPQPEEHDRCQDCAVTNLLGALKSVKSMGETNRETLKTLRDVAKHLWKDHSESGRELHKRVETSFRATRQSVFQYRAACNHLPVLQSLATGRECAEYEALLENGDDIIEEIGGKEFLDMLMETKTS